MLEHEIQNLKGKYDILVNLNTLLKVRLKAFEELANIINSEKDIESALNVTLDLVLKLLKVPSGSIMLLDRTDKYMEIGIARGDKSDNIKHIKINIGEGIAGKVAKTGDYMIVNDVSHSPDFNKEIGTQIHYIPKNILCVPIKSKDRILGVIEVMDKFETDFTEDDRILLESIANTVGIAILNVRLYQTAHSTVKKLQTLMDVSKIINTTMDLPELLNRIMLSSRKVLNAEGSSLMLIDDKTRELYFNVTTGVGKDKLKEVRIPIGKGIAGLVAQNGQSIIVEDAVHDPRVFKEADKATQIVTKNILAVPMRVKGKVIGVLEVINAVNRKCFDFYDQELLQAFADNAAIAVFNRDLINSLKIANMELTRSFQEIKAMYEMSSRTINETNVDKLFKAVVQIISRIFKLDKVSIMVYDEQVKGLIIKEAIGLGADIVNTTIVKATDKVSGYVYKNNKLILVRDMDKETFFGKNDQSRYNTRSFISIPLKLRDKTIGVLNVTERQDKLSFSKKDLVTFGAIGNQISKSYENIIYYNEFLEKQRIEKELEITRNIQQHVLPKEFPNIKDLDIAALNIPAKEVGGDFYDYIKINEKIHSFLIADVSGKSIPASMFMAFARSITRVEAFNLVMPSKVLEESNKFIFNDSKSGMFVTMFYSVINLNTSSITFGSAGHNEQLLYRKNTNEFQYLKVKGIPLGVDPDSSFKECDLRYERNDVFVLYTDGVTEAMNKIGEEFGLERLKDIIVRYSEHSAKEILDNILISVNEFTQGMPQFDDLTLLILKIR